MIIAYQLLNTGILTTVKYNSCLLDAAEQKVLAYVVQVRIPQLG
jgi:hypothetical protein